MVHFLGVDDITVLFVAQVGRVDAVGSQEFPVGHAESLTDGLCNQLCLWKQRELWEKRLSSRVIPAGSS